MAYSSDDLEGVWRAYDSSFSDEPLTRNLWAREGNWRLVGNGEKKDNDCGKFRGFMICASEEHDYEHLVGKNDFIGKVDVHLKHKSCFRYDCPVCYLSWAVHEAHAVDWKLDQLGKKYHVLPDHIIVSIEDGRLNPKDDYKKFDELLKELFVACKKRHVVGGVIIFHGFRYNDLAESIEKNQPFGWYWSPHWHIIGFIYGKKAFFESVEEFYKEDKFMFHLENKRVTVFGTAWYQLNHASVFMFKKRFCVARWFGVGRTNKIEKAPKLKDKCRICGRDMVKGRYLGKRNFAKDLQDCKKGEVRFFANRIEAGEVVWCKDSRLPASEERLISLVGIC